MQVSKIIPDPAVVTRNTAVAVPDTSAREMTGPFCQSAAVCPFVDLGRQADSRDLERPQMSAGVVEIAGDGCIADVLARTAPISCVDHRIVDAPGLGHQPATIQSTGDEIGRQRVAAAGEVTGRCAKSRRDQSGVLTPVYIGIFPFVDGVIAGRSAKQGIVRGLHGIFQGAGLAHT